MSPTTARHSTPFSKSRQRAHDFVKRGAWRDAEAAFAAIEGDHRFGLPDCLALAVSRLRVGHFEAAASSARRALEMAPDNLEAVHMLTLALMHQNRWSEALGWFERYAIGPARQHYHFVSNHATVLSQLGRAQEAVSVFLEAMVLEMTDPALHMKLGLAFKTLKMYEEAAESFLTAHVLDNRRFAAQLMVLHMRQYACQWDGFETSREGVVAAMEAMPEVDDDPRGEGAVWALAAIEHSPLLFRKACAQVAQRWKGRATPLPRRALATPGERRIRVGYVSSDFHSHATTLLMVEMLEHHDRERFEVTLYSHGKDDGSTVRRRVSEACEHFVDMRTMSEQAMARRIHADGIDILVDLKGHTFGNRLGLFAWRPAPVQVAWLGFPGTCGADYIDYIIGDRIVTPLEHAAHYSETIAQMPHSYQPNDSRRQTPMASTRAQWGLPEDAIAFGNFNQTFKLSPQTFDAWARILLAVPGSVLWLLADNPQATQNLQREAAERGLDPARLIFAPRVGVDAHLGRLPLADFMLDNWPCSAHTTASDALWMGVPLVTLMGESFASRVCGSLLHAVGLGELACTDVAAYEATTIALARDRERLAALRHHLNEGRAGFPLFDGARFARDIEALYERMWTRAASGLPAAPLLAEPA
jgi:predicted O-linked N-acetylglucosamine transferase (SPINDLY family)